jgi:hypothetical protein
MGWPDAYAAAIIATVSLLATLPVVRYLHPLGWMLSSAWLGAILSMMSSSRDRP